LSAAGYASKYGQRWHDYRKIAVVRNPADRFVSRHRYFLQRDQALRLAAKQHIDPAGVWPDLLKNDIRYASRGSFASENQQSSKLGHSSQYDYILRCESLDADWTAMLEKLELKDLPETLPKCNQSGDPVSVLDYITEPHLRAKLAMNLREDLDAYHYKIGAVSSTEQSKIVQSVAKICTGGCDLKRFLKRVYPVAD